MQPHKAIVGGNAFAREAGIHQDGMIKDPSTYEIIAPQSVGAPRNNLVLGKHSGRNTLQVRFEKLGFNFDRAQLDDVYRRFVALADKIKTIRRRTPAGISSRCAQPDGHHSRCARQTAGTWMAPASEEGAHPAQAGPASSGKEQEYMPPIHGTEREGRAGRLIVWEYDILYEKNNTDRLVGRKTVTGSHQESAARPTWGQPPSAVGGAKLRSDLVFERLKMIEGFMTKTGAQILWECLRSAEA